jgi:hypothetical protein
MCSPVNLSLKATLHSVRNTLLATIVVATQLVACGGGGGSDVVTSSSTGSSVPVSSVVSSNDSVVSDFPTDAGSDSVVPVTATGSFSLNWTAPTTRSDGTPLSLADIDGFRIYYGKSKGSYPNSVDVRDGSAQSAVVKNIPVGSYYVVMTTYDVSGLESGYSSAISKNVF